MCQLFPSLRDSSGVSCAEGVARPPYRSRLQVPRGGLMTATRTTARGVFAITDVLLAQVDPADAQPLASIAGVPGGGLVVSGDKEAKMAVRYLRGRGFRQLMLPDRQRYKGRNRLPAAHPFDSNWISWQ